MNSLPCEPLSTKTTHYRWVVCTLLFCATSIIYVDRQVFSILAPSLKTEFNWSESNYSFVVSAFTLAYALGYSLGGRMMDQIGSRKGFLIIYGIWSVAEFAHGLISPLAYQGAPWLKVVFTGAELGVLTTFLSVSGFSIVRFALGAVEGGHFPGAIKTVGQWHPKRERAFSTGIFNSGSNIGIIIAAYGVPFLIGKMQFGWTSAFFATGMLSFSWVVLWFLLYKNPEQHPRVSPAELAIIRSDPPDPPGRIPWLSLLGYRQTWAFSTAMFLASPIWWFYLYWLPSFLKNNHNIDYTKVFLPLLVVYLLADVGSIGGGSLSSWLIKRGYTINVARKSTFLLCALCVIPVVFVPRIKDTSWIVEKIHSINPAVFEPKATSMWIAVLIVGVACAAHAGFSANLYTIVSDTVPRKAVSSVVGIGGTAGCIGMLVLSTLIGRVLDWTEKVYGEKDYSIPFFIAGSAYLIATAVIHLLLPRLEPMKFDEARA